MTVYAYTDGKGNITETVMTKPSDFDEHQADRNDPSSVGWVDFVDFDEKRAWEKTLFALPAVIQERISSLFGVCKLMKESGVNSSVTGEPLTFNSDAFSYAELNASIRQEMFGMISAHDAVKGYVVKDLSLAELVTLQADFVKHGNDCSEKYRIAKEKCEVEGIIVKDLDAITL